MIRIASGPFGSGKTTRLLEFYREVGAGDGIVFPRVLESGRTTGYRVRRLSTGVERPFAAEVFSLPDSWDELAVFGRFSFSKSGFDFAAAVLEDILATAISPVWLDEVGPWELEGGGFAAQLEWLAVSWCDLYLGVRSSCVQDVIDRFLGDRRDEIEIVQCPAVH